MGTIRGNTVVAIAIIFRFRRMGKKKKCKLLVEAMKESGILPEQVFNRNADGRKRTRYNPQNLSSLRGSPRYVLVKGYGHYKCTCSNTWPSVHSWCIMDLRQQRIRYRYEQKCRSCVFNHDTKPYFKKDVTTKMAEYACQQHLYRTRHGREKTADYPDMTSFAGNREGSHDVGNCKMCKLKGYPCMSSTYNHTDKY